jgi:hypothetical protein
MPEKTYLEFLFHYSCSKHAFMERKKLWCFIIINTSNDRRGGTPRYVVAG